jgi:hypothetical protein
MSLYCLKALLDLKIPLKQRIRLIIGTCEESQWTDIQHYKEQFGQPDYGYSPDGEFPVFNIEKGYCDANLFFPSEGIELLEAGDSPNTVPSKAVIKVYGEKLSNTRGSRPTAACPGLGIMPLWPWRRPTLNTASAAFSLTILKATRARRAQYRRRQRHL